MKDPREVIIRPVITEHSYDMMEKNTYTFEVAKDANKVEIRQAVEAIFDVTVVKVNTLNVKSQAQARPPAARPHAHVEEGHGHPQGRRHHRAVRVLAPSRPEPTGASRCVPTLV